MAIKVSDLPARDRSRTTVGKATIEGHPVVVYCRACGGESSAVRGDCFQYAPDEELICVACGSGEDLILTQPRTVRAELTAAAARAAVGL